MKASPMTAPVAFVDTETTGLDPVRHEIWEIGLIVDDVEHQWFLSVDELVADPFALAIGGYDLRHPHGRDFPYDEKHPATCRSASWVLDEVAKLTHGRHLVGAVVSFDEERLRRAMAKVGVRPSWHYHIVDVEALAAGLIAARSAEHWKPEERLAAPPWDSEYLSRQVDVDPDAYDRHTALGDARWAKAIYDAVMTWAAP